MFGNNKRGFTLIELVVIIAALAILSAIAIPKFADISGLSKASACKGGLGGLRSAISIYNANSLAQTGTSSYPTIVEIQTVGTVMEQAIPPNPYQAAANAPDSIVAGVTKGVVVGTRGGWAYKASTGEIWPNTSAAGENQF